MVTKENNTKIQPQKLGTKKKKKKKKQ